MQNQRVSRILDDRSLSERVRHSDPGRIRRTSDRLRRGTRVASESALKSGGGSGVIREEDSQVNEDVPGSFQDFQRSRVATARLQEGAPLPSKPSRDTQVSPRKVP